jgi:hypothetical protein
MPGRRYKGTVSSQYPGEVRLRVYGHGPGLLVLADQVDLTLSGGQARAGDVLGADLGDVGTADRAPARWLA